LVSELLCSAYRAYFELGCDELTDDLTM